MLIFKRYCRFFSGTIKSEENYFYPPESMFEPPNFSMYISPRLAPTPRRLSASVPATKRGITKDSPFNERAKQGFKYWPHEQKPIDCKYISVRSLCPVTSRL